MEILFYSDNDPLTEKIMNFVNQNNIKNKFTYISYEKYGARFPQYIKQLPSIYSKSSNKLYERDQVFNWLNNIKSGKRTMNYDHIINTSLSTILSVESLITGEPLEVNSNILD